MGIASALLAEYNMLTVSYNWVTSKLLSANNIYDANAKQLGKLQEWEKQYDECVEDAMDGQEVKYRGEILNEEENYCTREAAEMIASIKVQQYDDNALQLCLDTDNYYETLRNTLKTEQELYDTHRKEVKTELDKAAQDSPSGGGGG